jgi:hypothetical protein
VLCTVATAVALPWFFKLVHVLVAVGASALVAALVLDIVLVAGVVAFGVSCAAASLRCLRFFRLIHLARVLFVPSVAAWRGEFHCHLVFVLDDCFYGFRHLVVNDVFLWYYSGLLQVCHQHSICNGEFVVISAVDGFNQDCIAAYFDHDHYVFVAVLGLHGKPACLVGECCFVYVMYSCEYISHILAHEFWCIGLFE